MSAGQGDRRNAVNWGISTAELEARRQVLGLDAGKEQTSSAPSAGQESERDRRLRLRAEERARRLAGGADSAYGVQSTLPGRQSSLKEPDSCGSYAARLPSSEELDQQQGERKPFRPAEPLSQPTAQVPAYPYFPDQGEELRARETEKKQRYAEELREMMAAKTLEKDRNRQDQSSTLPKLPESDQNDPTKQRKLQYKLELERQMEEQRRRKEEEKRLMKEKAQQDEAKYLAEFAAEQKRTGKKVSDPNRPSPDNPNAERYEDFAGKRRFEGEERLIGVAAKPPRAPPVPIESQKEPVEAIPYQREMSLPQREMSQPQRETTPPQMSLPPRGVPQPQREIMDVRMVPGIEGREALCGEAEEVLDEIQAIRRERDQAKAQMLELREMMLKEKESRLEDLMRMMSAPAYPSQWPVYAPYPQAYMQPVAYPPVLVQPPVPLQPQHYFSPAACESSARQRPSPKFSTSEKPESPEECIRPKDLRQPAQRPRDIPIVQRKDATEFFEESLSGSSKFVDPDAMQWGSTKLLASIQRLPEPQNTAWGAVLKHNCLKPEEMDQSLPSTVEHIPVEGVFSAGIEEVIEEEEDLEPVSISTPLAPPLLHHISEEAVTPGLNDRATIPDSSQTDLSRFTENDPVSLKSSAASPPLKPTQSRPYEADIVVPKNGNTPRGEPSPFILPLPGPRSTSASRSRPKTLDVFKAVKEPQKRPENSIKQAPSSTAPKPNFNTLQDARDKRRQEKSFDSPRESQESRTSHLNTALGDYQFRPPSSSYHDISDSQARPVSKGSSRYSETPLDFD